MNPTETANRTPARAIRPKDAATLIVVRGSSTSPEVLMGRRHERHKFMPGKYVFPGGRLDYADTRAPAVGDLDRDVEARLVTNTRAGMDARRARALALAAIRETFEETGLAIGVPQNGDHGISRSLAWRDFHKCGLTPRLDGLQFIARAITPPGRVRRFDTRFFAVDGSRLTDDDFKAEPGEELQEIDWLDLDAARALDLPRITRRVLDILEQRLSAPERLRAGVPVPFFFQRNGQWVTEYL